MPGRMVGQVGVNLPVEVVQQRGDGPLFFVLARSARIRHDACLYGQHVLPQTIQLYELAHDFPGLIPVHQVQCNIQTDGARPPDL